MSHMPSPWSLLPSPTSWVGRAHDVLAATATVGFVSIGILASLFTGNPKSDDAAAPCRPKDDLEAKISSPARRKFLRRLHRSPLSAVKPSNVRLSHDSGLGEDGGAASDDTLLKRKRIVLGGPEEDWAQRSLKVPPVKRQVRRSPTDPAKRRMRRSIIRRSRDDNIENDDCTNGEDLSFSTMKTATDALDRAFDDLRGPEVMKFQAHRPDSALGSEIESVPEPDRPVWDGCHQGSSVLDLVCMRRLRASVRQNNLKSTPVIPAVGPGSGRRFFHEIPFDESSGFSRMPGEEPSGDGSGRAITEGNGTEAGGGASGGVTMQADGKGKANEKPTGVSAEKQSKKSLDEILKAMESRTDALTDERAREFFQKTMNEKIRELTKEPMSTSMKEGLAELMKKPLGSPAKEPMRKNGKAKEEALKSETNDEADTEADRPPPKSMEKLSESPAAKKLARKNGKANEEASTSNQEADEDADGEADKPTPKSMKKLLKKRVELMPKRGPTPQPTRRNGGANGKE